MQNKFVPIILAEDVPLARFIANMQPGQAAIFSAAFVRSAQAAASRTNAAEGAKRVKVVASGIPGFFCVLRY